MKNGNKSEVAVNTVFTPEQLALKAHIDAENAKVLAWIAEDQKHRMAGIITNDLAHWAQYGITSVETYLFETGKSEYSDFYKSMYGMRPDLSCLTTLAQVDAALAGLQSERMSADAEAMLQAGRAMADDYAQEELSRIAEQAQLDHEKIQRDEDARMEYLEARASK